MDGKNKSMKKVPYTYSTKYGDKTVEAATTFDINKTIMRCLVKNLAMFGLGIYIYAGEDLPETESTPTKTAPVKQADTQDSLIELKKDTDNWVNVLKYISANKELGLEKIGQQLTRKYKISAALKKEIANLIK
jgi:NH3-dependent NAD+ synthetase